MIIESYLQAAQAGLLAGASKKKRIASMSLSIILDIMIAQC